MEELIRRTEAIDMVKHFGKSDPNLIIYNEYLKNGKKEKAEKFLKYRQKWEAVRNGSIKSDAPLFVTFALKDSCNLSCVHCYRRFSDGKKERAYLSLDKIYKLIDECKDIGALSVAIGSSSEPLLYKEVKEVIKYISDKEFEDFFIFTNAQLLGDDIVELILNSNVTRLHVSVDAARYETYKKVRGASYYRLMSNVFNFLDKRERKSVKLPILRVSFVDYNLTKNDKNDFINFWCNIADEVDVQALIDVKNINELRYSSIEEEKLRCDYPNSTLYINWDGELRPCCTDFSKHVVIGNIKDMSIQEAWRSDFINDLRGQLKKEKPLNKFCLNCLNSLRSREKYEALA
ncbi:MAG: radical SAM protein [Armatimonadota bacterium]